MCWCAVKKLLTHSHATITPLVGLQEHAASLFKVSQRFCFWRHAHSPTCSNTFIKKTGETKTEWKILCKNELSRANNTAFDTWPICVPFSLSMWPKQLERSCPVCLVLQLFEIFLISLHHYVFFLHCNDTWQRSCNKLLFSISTTITF